MLRAEDVPEVVANKEGEVAEEVSLKLVSDLFDDLLAKVSSVPSLALKYCCHDGKT